MVEKNQRLTVKECVSNFLKSNKIKLSFNTVTKAIIYEGVPEAWQQLGCMTILKTLICEEYAKLTGGRCEKSTVKNYITQIAKLKSVDNVDLIYKKLKRNTNSEWQIKRIDFEKCLYLDLKNGFDIEVSMLNTKSTDYCVLYLWLTKGENYVAKAYQFPKTTADIKGYSEIAKAYAENLIKHKLDSRTDIMMMTQLQREMLEYAHSAK